jgi:tetratricopeptide (TPR) repeat protein
MIVLPSSTYNRRRRLLKDFGAGRIAPEVFYQEMIELDPQDFIGLAGTGKILRERGDLAGAEEYFWKAIEANPADAAAYMELARALCEREEPELARGIGELAFRKLARAGRDLSDALDPASVDEKILGEVAALSPEERTSLFLYAMEEKREQEPALVTEKLRALRLIDRLQEEADLSAETVDAIIAEGRGIAPLLIGVIRAWAQNYLNDDEEYVMENAAALLGELGSAEELPPLLELMPLENETASGVASWAVNRIAKRHPEGAQAYFEENLKELDMVGLVKIAGIAVHDPEFDPWAKLLGLVGDRCDAVKKDSREDFFYLLTIAMFARGPKGIERAREMLRRNGHSLSSKARLHCEEFLAGLEDGATPGPPPPAFPYTIYEICAGEVSWEIDEDEDSLDEEPPERPVNVRQVPGRNDPCWCGSGKKYKKCHLDADANGSPEERASAAGLPGDSGEFDELRTRIGAFLRTMPRRDLKDAEFEFTGDVQIEDANRLAVSDWLVHDWILPQSGRTVIREFLAQNGKRLTPREREMAEAWSRSYVSLYETRELTTGKGVEAADLISGKTMFVHDVSMSNSLAKWDAFFGRVVPGERGTEFTGSGLIVQRPQLETMRAWLDEDRRSTGLEWPAYLKANWPRIRRKSFDIATDWRDSLRLANTDGEELLFCKSTYEVRDERTALTGLRGCAELEDSTSEDEEPSFVWLQPNRTVVAKIWIKGREAVLEVNSKERLGRAKALIAEAAGDSLRHLHDEFTTQKALREGAKGKDKTVPESVNSIPREKQNEIISGILEKHYANWPDTPLPALDGKTPREAAKTSDGRRQLAEVLKLIENGEERKRRDGEAFYDISNLRKELGV